ncbi:hypothetical protein ACFE04_021725 [Oxalis oulophora]
MVKEYVWAQKVWRLLGLECVLSIGKRDCANWMLESLSLLDDHQRKVYMAPMWIIWQNINGEVFGSYHVSVRHILGMVAGLCAKEVRVSNEDNEVECSRRNVASADGNNNSEAEFVGDKGKDNSSSDDEPCDDELVYDCDATEGLESSDGDDEELQRARNQLKHQKTTSKRNGIEGLVEALREIHGKKRHVVGSGLYIDPISEKQTMNPGTSGEYVVAEGRTTEIGWGNIRRPTSTSEWAALQRGNTSNSVTPPPSSNVHVPASSSVHVSEKRTKQSTKSTRKPPAKSPAKSTTKPPAKSTTNPPECFPFTS